MNKNKQLIINMAAQIIVFFVNTAIGFFVTPYLVNRLGSEAYGFIGLANNFVNYASLITIALNSMAGRFMTLAIHTGDIKKANGYFNSLLMSNVIIAAVMMIPSILCVAFIDKLINVPPYLLFDVRCTFAIVFLNFLLSTLQTAFGMGFFVRNKLYLNSLRIIESNILRISVILLMFAFMQPRITYMVIGSFASSIFIIITNIYYTKKLLPELKINKTQASWRYVKELIASGIWNCVTKLSQIFTSGLDLLVANLFIDAQAMGVLSLAKMLPNVIVGFITSIAGVFSPSLTILYAKNQIKELISETKSAMKILSVFSVIPNIILIVLGYNFFRLWVPSEDAHMLQILSVMTVINSCITGPIQPLYQIYTITNKVKINSIVMIIYGVTSIVITLIVLSLTDLGVYAIAGVSLVLSLVVSIVFHIPYTAKLLGMSRLTFFPEVIKSCLSCVIISAIGFGIKKIYDPQGWIGLIVMAIIIAGIGLVFNIFLVLNKREREIVYSKIRRKK